MTLWWVLPFFVRDVTQHPFASSLSSHFLYALVFGAALVCAWAFGALNRAFGWWESRRFAGKVVLLLAGYLAQYVVFLVVVLSFHSAGFIGYYGGDPEGSFFMGFGLFVVLYALAGGVACAAASLWKRLRRGTRG